MTKSQIEHKIYDEELSLEELIDIRSKYKEHELSKSELDKVSYIVFGKELDDYTFVFRDKFGLIKEDENTYKNAWYATAGAEIYLTNPNFTYNSDDIVYIEASILVSEPLPAGNTTLDDKVKFTLKYDKDKQLYTVSSIEKI